MEYEIQGEIIDDMYLLFTITVYTLYIHYVHDTAGKWFQYKCNDHIFICTENGHNSFEELIELLY